MQSNFGTKAAFLLFCLAFLGGCQGYSVTGGPGKTAPTPLYSSTAKPGDLVRINSLALAPLAVDSSLRDASEISWKVLSKEYLAVVRRELSLELLEVEDSLGDKDNVPHGLPSKVAALKQVEALPAEAVLLTSIREFSEREGSSIGSASPAQVSLEMEIFDRPAGRKVWSASYSFKDQALTSNLFKLGTTVSERGKEGWATAKGLFGRGVAQGCQEFSKQRLGAFSTVAAPK